MRSDLESPWPTVNTRSTEGVGRQKASVDPALTLEESIAAMSDRQLLEAIYRHILTAEGAVSGIHAQVGPIIEKIQESPIMQMLSM